MGHRSILLALLVGLLWPTAALAESTVTVGPTRQLVGPEQRVAVVHVSNAGRTDIRAKASAYAYSGGEWVEAPELGMFFEPRRFKLSPGEQVNVEVTLPSSTEPCRLMGAGFEARNPHEKLEQGEIAVQGLVVAQFVVQSVGGTEKDCLEVIPTQPSATPAPAPGIGGEVIAGTMWAWLFILLALLLGYGVYRLGKRSARPGKGSTYGL